MTLVVSGAMLAATTAPARAEHIRPHRHFIVTPDGILVEIGPDACTMGPSEEFDQFHANVHLGIPRMFAFARPNNPVDLMTLPCP